MSLYIPNVGIAAGLTAAIQRGMTYAGSPQGLAPALLHGHRKQLICRWYGTTDLLAFDEHWDPGRGDGLIELDYHPGEGGRGLPLPPNLPASPLNIRMGVPMWVVGTKDGQVVPLGFGLFHPLYTCAQLDFYNPDNRRFLTRMFYADPALEDGKASRQLIRRLMSEQGDDLRCRGAYLQDEARPFAPKLC